MALHSWYTCLLLGPQLIQEQVADKWELGIYSCLSDPVFVSHSLSAPSGLEYAQTSTLCENAMATINSGHVEHACAWRTVCNAYGSTWVLKNNPSKSPPVMSLKNGKKTVPQIVVNAAKSKILFWTNSHLSNGLWAETSCYVQAAPKAHTSQVWLLAAPVGYAQETSQQAHASQ